MLGVFSVVQHRRLDLGVDLPFVQLTQDHLAQGHVRGLGFHISGQLRAPVRGLLAGGWMMFLATFGSLHHFHKGLVRYS